MPLYEYQCDTCGHRFEVIQKFSDAPIEVCPKCGGAGSEAAVVAGDPVQGIGLVHHRLRAVAKARLGNAGAKTEQERDEHFDSKRGQARAKTESKPEPKTTGSAHNSD